MEINLYLACSSMTLGWNKTTPTPMLTSYFCVNTRVASHLVPKGRKTVYSLDPYRKSLIITILTLYIIFLMEGGLEKSFLLVWSLPI